MDYFLKHPKEITYPIEPPLEIDDYGFTFISSGNINTTLIDHSSTTNVAQQWEFTKTISHITITSASFAPSHTSSFEINSNSKQPKQLKCVFIIPMP
jgi:hypothetical protein